MSLTSPHLDETWEIGVVVQRTVNCRYQQTLFSTLIAIDFTRQVMRCRRDYFHGEQTVLLEYTHTHTGIYGKRLQ